jgi:hypothetical protein
MSRLKKITEAASAIIGDIPFNHYTLLPLVRAEVAQCKVRRADRGYKGEVDQSSLAAS